MPEANENEEHCSTEFIRPSLFCVLTTCKIRGTIELVSIKEKKAALLIEENKIKVLKYKCLLCETQLINM